MPIGFTPAAIASITIQPHASNKRIVLASGIDTEHASRARLVEHHLRDSSSRFDHGAGDHGVSQRRYDLVIGILWRVHRQIPEPLYETPARAHSERRHRSSFVVTHRVQLEDTSGAYGMFANKDDQCVKIVLRP